MLQKCSTLPVTLDYYKSFMEMQRKASTLKETSVRLQDHCFNVIVKNIIIDDMKMGMYFARTSPRYIEYSKVEKWKKKTKYCLQELYEKGEISPRDWLLVQAGMDKRQTEVINNVNKLLYEVYAETKTLLQRLGKL